MTFPPAVTTSAMASKQSMELMSRRAEGDNEELNDQDIESAEEEGDDSDDEHDNEPAEPVSGQVHLVPSAFGNTRAPTIYFEYPPELKIVRGGPRIMQERSGRKLVYLTNWERNCVKNAFSRAGFERTKSATDAWNGYWGKHPSPEDFANMNRFQKVNHFPGSWCIGRKDRLARTLLTFQRKASSEFDFHPEVLHMPGDRKMLELKMKAEKRSLWIIKPQASSCGRGIRVISKDNLDTVPLQKKAVMQKYIEKPHLINSRKYDLRLYVVVTSCDPLRIYLFEKGLVRFCANKYSMKNLKSKYSHLTNYSINKKSDKFVEPGEEEVDEEALKWSLDAYWKYMEELVGEEKVESIKESIKDVIVKTLIAAESDITPNLARLNRTRGVCYELFGFDVILDANLKPWLLEVNVSPSLMGSSPLDRNIKGTLMADVFHLVGFQPYDDQAIKKDERRNLDNKLKGIDDGRHKAALSRRQDSWRRTMSCSSIELKELSSDDWSVIYDTVEENQRRGHFERIYPTMERCKAFLPLFIATRFNDVLLHRLVSDRRIWTYSPLGAPFQSQCQSQESPRSASSTTVCSDRSRASSASRRKSSASSTSATRSITSVSSRASTESNGSIDRVLYRQVSMNKTSSRPLSSSRHSSSTYDSTRRSSQGVTSSDRPTAAASSSELRQTLNMKVSNPTPPVNCHLGATKQLVPTSVFKMHSSLKHGSSSIVRDRKEEEMEIKRLEQVIRQSESMRYERSQLKIPDSRYTISKEMVLIAPTNKAPLLKAALAPNSPSNHRPSSSNRRSGSSGGGSGGGGGHVLIPANFKAEFGDLGHSRSLKPHHHDSSSSLLSQLKLEEGVAFRYISPPSPHLLERR